MRGKDLKSAFASRLLTSLFGLVLLARQFVEMTRIRVEVRRKRGPFPCAAIDSTDTLGPVCVRAIAKNKNQSNLLCRVSWQPFRS